MVFKPRFFLGILSLLALSLLFLYPGLQSTRDTLHIPNVNTKLNGWSGSWSDWSEAGRGDGEDDELMLEKELETSRPVGAGSQSTWVGKSSEGGGGHSFGTHSPLTPPHSPLSTSILSHRLTTDSLYCPAQPLKQTFYHPNGHVLIPSISQLKESGGQDSRHPILTLVDEAEKAWNALVKKQSRTLREAVAEYRRRYRRNPPKGFDKWWDFAKKNKIVLVDEYDQIMRDVEPFWALDPETMMHRSKVMTQRAETFTLTLRPPTSKKVARVVITGEEGHLRRAKDLADLIQTFAHLMPGTVNLTFTKHDQPACELIWSHKEKMVEMAQQGEYFGPSEFFEPENAQLSNWANGCPPNSPLRHYELGSLPETHPSHPSRAFSERSFIYDHGTAMDVCQHPEAMPLHGFTTAIGTNPAELVPLWTFAKTTVHADILATPLEQYSDTYIGYDMEWELKPRNRLLWRGSTTGAEFSKGVDWQKSQRSRLHFMTHERDGEKDVLWAEGDSEVNEEKMTVGRMNEYMMSTGFSGGPVQCDPETCAAMERLIEFAPTMGLDDSYEYKYMMDVDGNGWSGRFHRLMSTKSCVLKSSIFPEWYTERVMPWVHYVPVKVDYSDLYDIMTFFVGTPDGRGSHDEVGAKIAAQGKAWARDHWRREDMAAYMFRILLEWHRVLQRGETDDLDFDMP